MIGQRTNFIKLGGPHSSKPGESGATIFDTSPDSKHGLDHHFFLKDSSGNVIEKKSSVFPTVPCYLLDGNAPGASIWFQKKYDLWKVDGIKEDTMMSVHDHTIFNAPMRAIAQSGDLVMARCGAYSSPGTLTRINDTNGYKSMTLRCPINYLQYAASAAPNVYSDTVGYGSMKFKTSTLRHAWLLSLTSGLALSDSPWNKGWSEQDQAIFKKTIDFHYALGPYLYSCAVDSYKTGYPHTLTPLPIAYPGDNSTDNLASKSKQQFQWMIGPSLLATPLLHSNYGKTEKMNIYLPAGKWMDYETGQIHQGPKTLTDFHMPLEKTPVFIGGKGIIIQRTNDKAPLKAVIYPVSKEGTTHTFTHPDNTSTSTITNNTDGWNPQTLNVHDTTANSTVSFKTHNVTNAISFDLKKGHNYELIGGK